MSSMFQLLKHYLPLCVLRHTDVRGDDRVSSEALGTLTEHAQLITWSGSCCRKSEQTCKGQEAGRHGKGLYGLYTNMVQACNGTHRESGDSPHEENRETERQRDSRVLRKNVPPRYSANDTQFSPLAHLFKTGLA